MVSWLSDKARRPTICGYKDHRAVDDAHGIITATVTTDAAVHEGHVLEAVLDAHENNTGRPAAPTSP
jgi:IS5 family transposase